MKNFNNSIEITIIKLNSFSLTASTYSRHIWLKLSKNYKFNTIINKLLYTAKAGKFYKGMRLECNGRFTRKQKAWHKVFKYGKMPLSTQNAFLDTSIITVNLKYGVASVRLNINYV